MATSDPADDAENSKDGRWTPEEHQRFVQAYETHGRDWRQIQEAVGTRSIQQVRSHGQKYFLKLQRQARNSASATASTLQQSPLHLQNILMRNYIQAIANVNIAFYTEMKKLMSQEGSAEAQPAHWLVSSDSGAASTEGSESSNNSQE